MPPLKTAVFALVLAVGGLPVGPVALAQGFSAPGWLRNLVPGSAPANPLTALDLTSEQVESLAGVAQKQRATIARLNAEIAALQAKHLVCDFWLQFPIMFQNKGKYGHLNFYSLVY